MKSERIPYRPKGRYAAVLLALALGLAACTHGASEPSDAYANAPAGEAPPPVSMAGNWDVFLLDEEEIEGELHFEADGKSIWWTPVCARQRRAYRITGDRIELSRDPQDEGPVAVCRIGLPPRLPEVMAALDAADTIQSAPAGAIRLHGGGHVILLIPHMPSGE